MFIVNTKITRTTSSGVFIVNFEFIFTNRPNLVINSGVHPSLRSNCHHQIVYCKLNLNIKFLPPYELLVWDYNKAGTEKIKKSIEQVHWEIIFTHKNPHQQEAIFNKTIIHPLSANPEKWSNTLKQIVGKLPTICLSVFDHFMNSALKGLIYSQTLCEIG